MCFLIQILGEFEVQHLSAYFRYSTLTLQLQIIRYSVELPFPSFLIVSFFSLDDVYSGASHHTFNLLEFANGVLLALFQFEETQYHPVQSCENAYKAYCFKLLFLLEILFTVSIFD